MTWADRVPRLVRMGAVLVPLYAARNARRSHSLTHPHSPFWLTDQHTQRGRRTVYLHLHMSGSAARRTVCRSHSRIAIPTIMDPYRGEGGGERDRSYRRLRCIDSRQTTWTCRTQHNYQVREAWARHGCENGQRCRWSGFSLMRMRERGRAANPVAMSVDICNLWERVPDERLCPSTEHLFLLQSVPCSCSTVPLCVQSCLEPTTKRRGLVGFPNAGNTFRELSEPLR